MEIQCSVTGEKFKVSELEIALRKKLGVGMPTKQQKFRVRDIGAFWQHWNLHKRKCDRSAKDIISVYRSDCAYPVWHKDVWVKEASPPGNVPDLNKEIFPQMWEVFKNSPIPHRLGAGNDNCEYTDDWWFSKNCYLCHSGFEVEDMAYCYRPIHSNNCQYSVFIFDCQRCVDVINSNNCFNVVYGLNLKNCSDSQFLYDCRNCQDCMFCFNLRNKKYCFGNKQLTKEEFEKKKAEWDLTSRSVYLKAQEFFAEMMKTMAWHRALSNDHCEASSGNYNEHCRNCEMCFFVQQNEDCVNCVRNFICKDSLDSAGHTSELCYYNILQQDKCYDVKFTAQLVNCKFMEYSMHCLNCENCFGCCGLVNRKYCIFNKEYSPEEYAELKSKIIEKMRETGEYEQFFPGYFAPNPYDESWSSFYFPLTKEEQLAAGYNYLPPAERFNNNYFDPSEIPDCLSDFEEGVLAKVFWDQEFHRPFKIRKADVDFAKMMKVPLPYDYYINRIQRNFRWLSYDGDLRKTKCAESEMDILTSWPKEYDGRILSEESYLKMIA